MCIIILTPERIPCALRIAVLYLYIVNTIVKMLRYNVQCLYLDEGILVLIVSPGGAPPVASVWD